MESATERVMRQSSAEVITILMVLFLRKYMLSPQREVFRSLLRWETVISVVMMGDCLWPLMNMRMELGMGKYMLRMTQLVLSPEGVLC